MLKTTRPSGARAASARHEEGVQHPGARRGADPGSSRSPAMKSRNAEASSAGTTKMMARVAQPCRRKIDSVM